MKKIELFSYILIGLTIAVGAIVAWINPDYFEYQLTVEDGPIEWLTVVMLFLAGCVMLYRAVILRKARTKLFILMTALAGLLMWFGAGEEIAWGQRILGFKASGWMKEHNTQGDVTLHNLKFGNVKINKLVFSQLLAVIVLSYLLVLPYLAGKKPGVKKLTETLAIPIATRTQIIMWLVAMALPELVIKHKRKGEIREACAGVIIFVTLLNPRNRSIYDPKISLPSRVHAS